MNLKQFNMLKEQEKLVNRPIAINDLHDKSERTLLYGFTCERNTWHVYIKNNHIHVVEYGRDNYLHERTVTSDSDYIPDKRLYPSACDFEFCMILKAKGIYLPFTHLDDRDEKQYYGEIL